MSQEIIIPPQVRAARALLGWSQEDLARKAGVAVTTVRDVEGERRSATAAAGEVVRALRNGGVEFVPGTANAGPGVRLAIDRPNLLRKPQAMSSWDGLPMEVEFRGARFTAFVSVEVLEDLAAVKADEHPSDEQWLQIFERFRTEILEGVRVAFERGESWNRARTQLRVRPIDLKELVPPHVLVTSNPVIMGGAPVFAGTRVPIDVVLSSLERGVGLEEITSSYPFLTAAHVEAARTYAKEHSSSGSIRDQALVPSGWKVKKRRTTRRDRKK